MATSRIGEVPLVGGHRALDLVNTVAPRLPEDQSLDYLVTQGDLLIWSQRAGLADADTAREVEAAWSASPAAGRRALAAVKEQDVEKRRADYEDLEKKQADASPFVYMFQGTHKTAVRSNVKGLVLGFTYSDDRYGAVSKE